MVTTITPTCGSPRPEPTWRLGALTGGHRPLGTTDWRCEPLFEPWRHVLPLASGKRHAALHAVVTPGGVTKWRLMPSGHTSTVAGFAVSSGGTHVTTVAADGTSRSTAGRSPPRPGSATRDTAAVRRVRPDGSRLALGTADGRTAGRPDDRDSGRAPGHRGRLARGSVVSGRLDGSVRTWDPTTDAVWVRELGDPAHRPRP